ncbi:hypothetical protein Tco_0666828 [Tanacetum coccineum]
MLQPSPSMSPMLYSLRSIPDFPILISKKNVLDRQMQQLRAKGRSVDDLKNYEAIAAWPQCDTGRCSN